MREGREVKREARESERKMERIEASTKEIAGDLDKIEEALRHVDGLAETESKRELALLGERAERSKSSELAQLEKRLVQDNEALKRLDLDAEFLVREENKAIDVAKRFEGVKGAEQEARQIHEKSKTKMSDLMNTQRDIRLLGARARELLKKEIAPRRR